MEFYFAGIPGGEWEHREKELSDMWKYRLWSYYHILKYGKTMDKPGNTKLFLDSGAFSAWNSGIDINFIKHHDKLIDMYANLDVINDADATWKNQKIMEAEGMKPLPVFHVGEPIKYLYLYMDKYEHIAIGGIANLSTPKRLMGLDTCFNIICDDDGIPRNKVHSFGMSSLGILRRYPWYSADSTSWASSARYGYILVPRFRRFKWIYDENCYVITVSDKSNNISKKAQHIETMSKLEKELIIKYLKQKGYNYGNDDVKGVSNDYKLRERVNIDYYNNLVNSLPEWPWAWSKKSVNSMF
jgi:hypothetical protein